MAADNDWDLGAVVRSCRAAAAAKTLERRDFASFPLSEAPLEVWEEAEGAKGGSFFGFSDLFQISDSGQELEELCKPFLINRVCQRQQLGTGTVTDSHYSVSAASVFAAAVAGQHQPPQPARQPPRSLVQMPRSKRRRNQQKKVVCHVSAARLSDDDVWAWRKYGQKPIKGSPYPRGYYRCSSSKGCLARKQVERSRADPAMFIITYTAEHNHPVPTHRNSLAGSTRHKFASPTPVAIAAKGDASSVTGFPPHSQNPTNSPLYSSAAGLSPTTPLTSSMEDELLNRRQEVDDDDEADDDEIENEEEMLLVEDMEVMGEDELLFVGVAEEVAIAETREAAAEFLDDEIEFGEYVLVSPWSSNSKNTAAAAGSS
ncbi:putative WRKY transcription factor 27 [Curcuma longa]|uniref:putative WRKY transcription factor 27 n=1 Tax=Curcuma longa TaxID=136217 RepID=UPI003D9F9A8F